jgi:hypothetical protein
LESPTVNLMVAQMADEMVVRWVGE